VTGNDQIGDYQFLNLYNSAQFPYEGTQALYPANLYNPDLAWEQNRKLEGGLELGLFKDRILGGVSYYVNRSSNQLVTAPVSAVTGFTGIEENLPALVQNTGLEISVVTVNVKSKSFSWSSNFVWTVPRNKLLAFPGLANSEYNSTYEIGQPLNIRRLFHMAGVNDATGIYQFSAGKGGVTYNPQYPQDLTATVNMNPRNYGGLGNVVHYKQFTLDFFFQFVQQKGMTFLYGPLPGGFGHQQPVTVLSRWQKPGDVTGIQQFSENYGGQAFTEWINAKDYSDQMYGNASYVRLRNLSFSYTFSDRALNRMHLAGLSIYVRGQNLLTFTKYIGYDPENQSSSTLPPLRVLTAGIKITL
jgi:hypothetical protein